jgi:hypothetical protein
MNKADLLKMLDGIALDAEIVLSKDGEGNSFSPLADHSVGYYVPDSTWSGRYYPHPVRDPEYYGSIKKGWAQLDDMDGKSFCVVLWPVN